MGGRGRAGHQHGGLGCGVFGGNKRANAYSEQRKLQVCESVWGSAAGTPGNGGARPRRGVYAARRAGTGRRPPASASEQIRGSGGGPWRYRQAFFVLARSRLLQQTLITSSEVEHKFWSCGYFMQYSL